jgi:hypothetical protein
MIRFHTKKIWGFHDGEDSYFNTVGYDLYVCIHNADYEDILSNTKF